ncbi:hypothetical protein ACFLSG_03955 [Candidatus Bipolaricaulota bacterium]
MRTTITLLCCSLAWIGAVAGCFAAEPQIQVRIELDRNDHMVGEPISIAFELTNVGNSDLIHEEGIFTDDLLAGSILVLRLLPDGEQEVIVSDRPVQIPPPLPASPGGEDSAYLVPSRVLGAGETRILLLHNVLRSIPFLENGEYEVVALLILPWYEALAAEGEGSSAGYVDLYAAQSIAVASSPLALDVTAPEATSEEDLEALTQARVAYGAARMVEEAVRIFAVLQEGTSDLYVAACAQYWIGEAYQRFGLYDRAVIAYEAVISEFSDSSFAVDAMKRMEEIAAIQEMPY